VQPDPAKAASPMFRRRSVGVPQTLTLY
jgi:hypothetical protein